MNNAIKLAGLAATVAFLATAFAATDIKLPPETAALKSSPLAGHAIANQKCGVCHSADYVDYQPPMMTKTQWTAEMTKMQKLYGAPITDDEVKLLGIYLADVYGDAATVTADDRALQLAIATPALPAGTPDVQALLTASGCLACHAVDRTIVGPGYHDVAARYKADAAAQATVAASIRRGGSGRWGTVPMPPFAGLSADEAQALASYVLKQ